MKKILIIGGGFSGLEAAIHLSKDGFDVTLASNRDYFYMYPAAMWVPTGEKDFRDICMPLKDFSSVHGFSLKVDQVLSISTKENKVVFATGEVSYDYLILATGPGKVNIPGMAENTLTICGPPDDVVKLKEKINNMIKNKGGRIALGIGNNPADQPSLRIGPAVELLLNLNVLLKRKKLRDKFELTFFCPVDNPFVHVGKVFSKLFMSTFNICDKPAYMGKKIKEFTKGTVVFEDDTKLESDLIMITPGANGHPLYKNSDLPLDDCGFIKISSTCQVEGTTNAFAVGDCVCLHGSSNWLVRQGHNAVTMGKCTAYNIKAIEQGNLKQKNYTDHLWMGGLLDGGNGAAFLFKTDKKLIVMPLPYLGHWMKKAWVSYYKLSRLNKVPRIFGM